MKVCAQSECESLGLAQYIRVEVPGSVCAPIFTAPRSMGR